MWEKSEQNEEDELKRTREKRFWSLDKHKTEKEKRKRQKEEVTESSTSSWWLLVCPKERAVRSHESSRGAPAQHDYNDSTTHGTRRVTTKQSTWRQTRHSNSHTNTSIRSRPHTPHVCSQAMPEVMRDKEMRKSKRGRKLVPVEYTAQGIAHRTQKIYRSCKSDTNISPKHSYTQTACEGLLKVMTNENDI